MQDATIVSTYEAAIPDDPRVQRKRMFGTPCAFVNRQMFFGTFENTIVARVGPERAEELAEQASMQVFTPQEGRVWADYVQLDMPVDEAVLAVLAVEALAWAAALPKKAKRPSR
ncbi:MAG: hypothetical protein GWP91_24415 [Rhodobacterales bacterium]|nr:hypothetical protein [Rhodobacterales bacterium]